MSERMEEDLRRALSRREPPPGFADSVMQRIPPRRSFLAHRWMAVAAALIVLMFAGAWRVQHERQRRAEAEKARADLIYALEVTSVKLQETRTKVFRKLGGSI